MRRRAFATSSILLATAAACGLDDTVLRDAPDAAAIVVDGGASDALIQPFDVTPVLGAHGVFAGQYFTCAIVVGRSYCWGSNVLGGLGTGDLQGRLTPTAVATGVAFRSLAPGESHACGLEASAGRVLCWGSGASGQLGLGDTQARSAPDVVPGLAAQQLSAGYSHTCAVTVEGALFCWGNNEEGQLGLGDGLLKPNPTPVQVGAATDWLMASGGQGHTCGIRKPGTMWCWGRNNNADLGLGEGQPGQIRVPTRVGTFDDYTAVDLGQDNACALRKDGSLWCWGSGEFVGAASPDANGYLFTPTQIGSDTDWTQVSVDVFSACAVKSSGALYCWGRNAEGQLGAGDTSYRGVPTRVPGTTAWAQVSVGRFHTCAESTTREIACTGVDESGELGLGDTARRNVFTPVAFPATR